MKTAIGKIGTVLLLALCCSACRDKDVAFYTFNHLPPAGWDKGEIQSFVLEIEDTLSLYDIDISLRYTNDYVYSNLWLFIGYTDESGVQRTDTLECRLADVYGKWYGSGWGASYQQIVPFKKQFRFPVSGTFPVTVQQGMREDVIHDIEDIGLRVTKVKPED